MNHPDLPSSKGASLAASANKASAGAGRLQRLMAAARDRINAADTHQGEKRVVGNNANSLSSKASSSSALDSIRTRLALQSGASNAAAAGTATTYKRDSGDSEPPSIRNSPTHAVDMQIRRDTSSIYNISGVKRSYAPSAELLAALEDEARTSIAAEYHKNQYGNRNSSNNNRNEGGSRDSMRGGNVGAIIYGGSRSAANGMSDDEVIISSSREPSQSSAAIYSTVSVGDRVYVRHAVETGGKYKPGVVRAVIHRGFTSARYDVDISGNNSNNSSGGGSGSGGGGSGSNKASGVIITVPWMDIKLDDGDVRGRDDSISANTRHYGRDTLEEEDDRDRCYSEMSSGKRRREDEYSDGSVNAVDAFGRSIALKARVVNCGVDNDTDRTSSSSSASSAPRSRQSIDGQKRGDMISNDTHLGSEMPAQVAPSTSVAVTAPASSSSELVISDAVLSMAKGGWKKRVASTL